MLALRMNRTHPANRLRSEMDRLFGGAFEGLSQPRRNVQCACTFPAVNLWEDADNLYAEAELPGLKLEDLELLVMDNELTIKRCIFCGRNGALWKQTTKTV